MELPGLDGLQEHSRIELLIADRRSAVLPLHQCSKNYGYAESRIPATRLTILRANRYTTHPLIVVDNVLGFDAPSIPNAAPRGLVNP